MIGPGIHHNISAAEYHADPCEAPSLSASIARLLIDKTPAHARLAHPRLNPGFETRSTTTMDVGSVAHELLLGSGGGFELSPYSDYKKKVAQDWRYDVIARGLTPIKAGDYARAIKIVDAVHACVKETHGTERAFLEGHGEAVVIWDDIADTKCRAMIDWCDLEKLAVYDLKTTCLGLSDHTLQNSIAGGLDLQAAFHLRGLEHVKPELANRIAWFWVFVENEEPFEARIIERDTDSRIFGNRKASQAIERWAQCLSEGCWPGYPRMIERLPYPVWAQEEIHL